LTSPDFFRKWTAYALALIAVLCLECFIMNRLPVWGVTPRLLPLAAVIVAVLEGPLSGAGFGLAVGILADAVYPGLAGGMTLILTFLGLGMGLLCRYFLHQNYLGCLICSILAFFTIDLIRIMFDLLTHVASLSTLCFLAFRELSWSLVFTVPLYWLFRAIHRRISRSANL